MERGSAINAKPDSFDPNLIKEQVKYSRYSSASNLHPFKGQTEPNPNKGGAYTWLKAPRYNNQPMEVGPLARVAISYLSGNKAVKTEVDGLLKVLGGKLEDVFSVLGRHACRAIESKLICIEAENGWMNLRLVESQDQVLLFQKLAKVWDLLKRQGELLDIGLKLRIKRSKIIKQLFQQPGSVDLKMTEA